MPSPPSTFVLYVDHSGHAAPLSLCYHATASRRLSSSLNDRHPPSTIEEVDSAYCPQCLTFHDAGTASNLGHCPKASCKRCPLCQSIASLAFEDNECFYDCGYCDWTSKECGLIVSIEAGTVVNRETMAKATEQMKQLLEAVMSRDDADSNQSQYKDKLAVLEGVVKEELRRKKHPNLVPMTKKSAGATTAVTPWSLEQLEASLEAKSHPLASDGSAAEKSQGQQQQGTSSTVSSLDGSVEKTCVDSILLQSHAVRSGKDLLPLPVQLRPRKSRRCRAELAEGRPGILVKPKLNPLEGDTSLRTGHGQWWKKDASAVQVIPKVSIVQHQHTGDAVHAFLLKISNPTLGQVKLRLAPSSFLVDNNKKTKKSNDEETMTNTSTKQLNNMLVHSLYRTRLDVTVNTGVTLQTPPSDMIELDSVDDTFLDLGRSEIPEQVTSWDGNSSNADKDAFRVVATKGDSAWVEYVLAKKLEGTVPGIPVSLQIQVGGGSWESSLVKAKANDDFVVFDIVLLWSEPTE